MIFGKLLQQVEVEYEACISALLALAKLTCGCIGLIAAKKTPQILAHTSHCVVYMPTKLPRIRIRSKDRLYVGRNSRLLLQAICRPTSAKLVVSYQSYS